MSTIFISHSSRDGALAAELRQRLARHDHHSVFLDFDPEQGIVAGQSWEQTLYRKLRACRAVIALCTDHYLKSHWCFAEVALARMEGKQIFALQADPLSDDATMPAILTDRQFIDLRHDGEEGYRRLWKGLEEQDLLGVAGEWDPRRSPYLGLDFYREEDAPVFFGREEESRAALELTSRGAPGLIMVLGASGSGKSSLVRAGMLPRLRRDEHHWLVVDPFRPGRDPHAELAESLLRTARRYAPAQVSRLGSVEEIRARLHAWTPQTAAPRVADADADAAARQAAPADQRLTRLLRHLEDLREHPPDPPTAGLRDFLEWSLEDLQRISREPGPVATAARSGTTPLVELARDLQRGSGRRNARVLLVVDQFEELLDRGATSGTAQRFLALLRASVETESGVLMALGTMRSDFLGSFQRDPALRGIDFESLSLGPMKLDGMRRVIEEPARLGAIELETGLADRLLEDTETPDALPLLSFTLAVLWRDCRDDGRLTVREYERLGGLAGAVAKEADALLAAARRQRKEEPLRRAFLRMARLTDEGSHARQQVPWDSEELRPVHAILERFVERRLLVSRADGATRTVEVAHEALFRSWAPLETWLEDNRAELLLRQQLERDAAAWDGGDRAEDRLWRGGRLQQARELIRGDASGLETEFIRAGVRRASRERRQRVGIVATVFVALAALAGWAWWKGVEADREKQSAEARLRDNHWSNAIVALERDQRLKASHFFARAANGESDAARTAACLLGIQSTLEGVHLVSIMHHPLITDAIFSHDGTRILTFGENGVTRLWQTGDATPLSVMKHDAPHGGAEARPRFDPSAVLRRPVPIWDARFSPDDTRILTLGQDGKARLWHAHDGSSAGEPVTHESELGFRDGEPIRQVGFNRDGTRVLTRDTEGSVQVWDGTDLRPVTGSVSQDIIRAEQEEVFDDVDPLTELGSLKLTERDDGEVWLQSTRDGALAAQPMKHDGETLGAIFSDDGSWILTCGDDDSARLWRVELDTRSTGQAAETAARPGPTSAVPETSASRIPTYPAGRARLWHPGVGPPAAFGRDEGGAIALAKFERERSRIMTYGSDGTLWSWNAEGEPADALVFGGASSWDAWFGNRATLMLTVENHAVRLWDAEGRNPAAEPLQPACAAADAFDVLNPDRGPCSVDDASFSRDGSRILVGASGPRFYLFARSGELVGELGDEYETKSRIREDRGMFSPDGSLVLIFRWRNGHPRLWDAATGKPLANEMTQPKMLGATFSPSGSLLSTYGESDTVRLWNAPAGTPAGPELKHEGEVEIRGAIFDREESRILTFGRAAHLWDVRSGEPVHDRPLEHPGGDKILGATFNRDESLILTWSNEGAARLWNAEDGTPAAQLMKHEDDALVYGARFNHDESLIVTFDNEGSVHLWYARDGAPLTRRPLRHPSSSRVWDAIFSGDESRIVAFSDGRARSWPVAVADRDFPPEHVTLLVESITGTRMDSFGNVRTLSAEEWAPRRDRYVEIAEAHADRCRHRDATRSMPDRAAARPASFVGP